MSGRSNSGIAAARWRTVWRMHERGTAGRAIARDLGISQKTVQHYLAKGRPDGLSDGLRPSVDRHRRPSPVADIIIAGSARVHHTESDDRLVTLRCGRCGHEQETRADGHTATCRQCGRTCRLDAAAGENVIPMRRTS